MNHLPDRPKIPYPAKINVQKSVAAGRRAGIPEKELRRMLASGKLGRTIPDQELHDIDKGMYFNRWADLDKAIAQCDKRLAAKDLPPDIAVALLKAKGEFIAHKSQLSADMRETSKRTSSHGNGQLSPHSFGPREQIGNVAAVQVTIGTAQQSAPVTDVPHVQSIPEESSPNGSE